MSRFLSLLSDAKRRDWCTSPTCTTCGALEFKTALGKLGGELTTDLATLDLDQLEAVPQWQNPTRLALDELDSADSKDHVLEAWLPQLEAHVRLADIVLFYYVRRGTLFAPMSITILKQWLQRCIDIACRTRDASLVESLVYTLGPRVQDNSELAAVIREIRRVSRPVALAMERAAPDA